MGVALQTMVLSAVLYRRQHLSVTLFDAILDSCKKASRIYNQSRGQVAKGLISYM